MMHPGTLLFILSSFTRTAVTRLFLGPLIMLGPLERACRAMSSTEMSPKAAAPHGSRM